MENQQNKATKFFNKVTSHYKTIMVLSIIVMVFVSFFISKLTKDTDYDSFIPSDDSVLVFRDQLEKTFGLKDPMVVAIVNEDGVFNKETLQLVHKLSEAIIKIPGVDPDQVTSLATENNIVGTEDGLLVDPFFEIDGLTDQKAKDVKAAIDDFELYQGSLVSKDYTTTLIVSEMLDSYSNRQFEVYRDIEELLKKHESRGEQLYLAGEGAVSGYLMKYIDDDAMKIIPLSALVISLILLLAYRRLRGVIIPNIMVMASVGIAIGVMAAVGVNFFVITNGLLVVIIAIAVADGIHILGEYYETVAKYPSLSQKEIVVKTMSQMWRPVAITSITTVSGFLSLALTSYMPPMIYFGIFGALGVVVALIYAIFMIPSALMFVKPQLSKAFKVNQETDRFGKIMGFIGKSVIKHPKTIVAISIIIIAFGINGAFKLTINENRINNFQSEENIVIADKEINKRIDGTSYLDVLIETPENEDIFIPENLHKIEALQNYIETLPHVNGSTSIVDFVKKMNQSLNENNPDFYKIPDNQDLISQYFLLYSASGNPTDFDNYVDYDYRLANVRFRMDSGEYLDEKPVVEQANAYIEKHFNNGTIKATTSGKVTVDAHWIDSLGSNHFIGAAIALLIVFLFAAISFRSSFAGFLTIIPVAISVLFIYTVMGVLDIWLAVGTSMFAAIAIGVGVDFAVHTIDRLKHSLSEKQLPLDQAYMEFYKSSGRSLLFNFLALALGFGVLSSSVVPPMSNFGFLVAIAVVVSFIGSLTLLPAIIYLAKPKFLKIKS